jgi:hypothetical protein
MAKISDDELTVNIKPDAKRGGHVDYTFDVLFDSKPLFNPELTKNLPIFGSDYNAEV